MLATWSNANITQYDINDYNNEKMLLMILNRHWIKWHWKIVDKSIDLYETPLGAINSDSNTNLIDCEYSSPDEVGFLNDLNNINSNMIQ